MFIFNVHSLPLFNYYNYQQQLSIFRNMQRKNQYHISSVDISIVKNNPQNYNTNNHWSEDIRPLDYDNVVASADTALWIDQFHKYEFLDIKASDLKWMKKAFVIGTTTGQFPELYRDELQDCANEYNSILNSFKTESKNGWFIKAGNVSLKSGCHGIGPYYNIEPIIESIVTSMFGHTPIDQNSNSLRLYFLPWIHFNLDKEFRIFVCNNKITAISQQNVSQENSFLKTLPFSEQTVVIHQWIDLILKYFENVVIQKITHVQNYTIDLCLLDLSNNIYKHNVEVPYFIEMNCFGKEYSAGSSLFHWLIDKNILYNEDNSNIVHFKYAL